MPDEKFYGSWSINPGDGSRIFEDGFIKKLDALSDTDFEDFFKDIADNVPAEKLEKWGETFGRTADNLDMWKKVKGKLSGKKQIDAYLLNALSEAENNHKLFEMMGDGVDDIDDFIENVLKPNYDLAPCKFCGEANNDFGLSDIDDYVDNLNFISKKINLDDNGVKLWVNQLKSTDLNNVKGASFTSEVLKDGIENRKFDPMKIKLEHKYLDDRKFAADIVEWDAKGKIKSIIDQKNWSKFTIEQQRFNLDQAKAMISTGNAKYNFRMRDGVTDKLVKENYAEWLKKGANPYQNLRDIADVTSAENLEKVFGFYEVDDIIEKIDAKEYDFLNNLIELKNY